MKIAVTGVAGFIGSNLADRLLQLSHAVVGIDSLAYGRREQIPAGVDFRQADIRDEGIAAELTGCDVLYHLAAKNSIPDCQSDPLATADINVTGSVNMFRAAAQAGVRRVIYAESSSVYEGSNVLPTPETESAPRSFYAISKAAVGAFARGFAEFGDLEFTALRYFGVYGPRQDYLRTIPPVMSAFIIKLLRGERPIIYGDGEKRRDFIYVDDVNDFHQLCLTDRRTVGGTYNLGYGEPFSVNELYRIVAALLDSPILPDYRPDLSGEAQTTHADISRARALGWAPQIDLDEGLRRSIRYIREHVIGAE